MTLNVTIPPGGADWPMGSWVITGWALMTDANSPAARMVVNRFKWLERLFVISQSISQRKTLFAPEKEHKSRQSAGSEGAMFQWFRMVLVSLKKRARATQWRGPVEKLWTENCW